MTEKLPFLLRHLFLSFLLATIWPVNAASLSRPVAGLVEKVLVGSPGVEFEAKLDTGADISSIDAIEITLEKRSGRRWVSFSVLRVDGERVKLSGRLVRHAHIKQAGGTTHRRPVVLLEICLGSVSRTVEVSLADRRGLDYDVLIGRNFLSGYFVVDPARVYTVAPACAGQPQK